MVEAVSLPVARDQQALVGLLDELAGEDRDLTSTPAGKFNRDGKTYEIPRFRFKGPAAEHDSIRLGIFAGLHGDEPSGCSALVQFLAALCAEPGRAKGYDLFVYPVCNPTGLEDGTRFNRAGFDLNREFWHTSSQPEIQVLEAELQAHHFHGIITLHEDDTSEGIYGYAHGRVLNEALLKPALFAAERLLPRDNRSMIDGFSATGGVLCHCFEGVLSAPPTQSPQPFDLIFETPGRAPFPAQVLAGVAALESILDEYRGFIAYGQDL